jgi:hypothetical protein
MDPTKQIKKLLMIEQTTNQKIEYLMKALDLQESQLCNIVGISPSTFIKIRQNLTSSKEIRLKNLYSFISSLKSRHPMLTSTQIRNYIYNVRHSPDLNINSLNIREDDDSCQAVITYIVYQNQDLKEKEIEKILSQTKDIISQL